MPSRMGEKSIIEALSSCLLMASHSTDSCDFDKHAYARGVVMFEVFEGYNPHPPGPSPAISMAGIPKRREGEFFQRFRAC